MDGRTKYSRPESRSRESTKEPRAGDDPGMLFMRKRAIVQIVVQINAFDAFGRSRVKSEARLCLSPLLADLDAFAMARALVLMGLSLFMLQHAPVCARAAFRRLSLRATLDPSVTSELLDKRFAMKLALAHATKAFSKGEVPIGAVVLGPDGRVIGVGRNQVEQERDASAHAEIAAMRAAAKQVRSLCSP
eukprot:scaffold48_cov311-Pinguiococcus_pyrenoidosus.AAC.295